VVQNWLEVEPRFSDPAESTMAELYQHHFVLIVLMLMSVPPYKSTQMVLDFLRLIGTSNEKNYHLAMMQVIAVIVRITIFKFLR